MKKLEVKKTLKKGADKVVEFTKAHQLEIGYAIGIATVVYGSWFYEKLNFTQDAMVDIYGNNINNTVRMDLFRKCRIGAPVCWGSVRWDAESARKIGEALKGSVDHAISEGRWNCK